MVVCGGGLTACGETCVDTDTDADNCGGCGRPCTLPNALAQCTGGACAITACTQGYADCDANPANGCEVHVADDAANCGGCGHACAANEVCVEGACQAAACVQPLQTCTAGGASCCDGRTCGGLTSGCGGSLRCCAAANQECFNACDCCNAGAGAGCAFPNGGDQPGYCTG